MSLALVVNELTAPADDLVTGQEERCARIRKLEAAMANTKAQLDEEKRALRNVALIVHDAAARNGRMRRNILFNSADGTPVRVTVRDAYSKLPASNEAALREALGERYHQLVTETTAVGLAPKRTLDQLEAACGAYWPTVRELLAVKTTLKPSRKFAELRAELLPVADDNLREALHTITRTCRQDPAVVTKGSI